jgi:hypothetical protein
MGVKIGPYVKKYRCSGLLTLFLLFSATQGFGQSAAAIPKLSDQLVFDGKLDEPFWDDMKPLDMVAYQPVYKGTMSEDNQIYLLYDENFIYLAARLFHRDTGDIRSNSLYRDQYSSDDTFALILDTFNDDENALWFFTNPAGNRFDALVSNDAEETNFDWNTYWDVLTERTDRGWSVEMRVPFSSLGFQSANKETVMGATVYRYLSKNNERYIYPDIPPNWDNGFRKPSQAQKILLTGINDKNPVYITPYLLGGLEQRTELNSSAMNYEKNREWTHEPGLDVKMNLTSNLTADFTVNTDFAQVEADDQQINLTRFPLFFPEKRQFFQERSSIFNFGFSRESRLFNSRRIGLAPTGEPIRIYGGARMVGKINSTDVGFINMQTASSGSLSSENFNVLRVKRKIFNRYSTIGGMFTSRIGSYENDNYAYGMDAIIRVIGDEYLTLKVAQTQESKDFDWLSNSRFYLQWQRRKNNGLSYEFNYDRTGDDFNPQVGFTPRTNFSLFQKLVRYTWLTNNSPLFQEVWVGNFANAFLRNDDQSTESAVINPIAEARFKNGASLQTKTNIRYENLLIPFVLFDEETVSIPAGSYWYQDVELQYDAPNGWKFRPSLKMEFGGFFDGARSTFGIATEWNLSSHLELGSEYEYNDVRFSNRSQLFDTHIARLRLRAALNTKLSLTSFVQYNSDIDKTSINARFRYNFGEGEDFWIVYDNVVNTNREQAGLPRLPTSSVQALLVKFTYTFKR